MQERIEQSMLAEPNSPLRGTVENKAAKPAGLLPRNTQQLVILGVAVVMVFIMWLTSSAKRPPKTTASSTGSGSVHPLDPAAVQDFKQTIQKEQAATRQPISPSDLARLQALGLAGDVAPGSQLVPAEAGVPAAGGVIGGAAQEQSPPPDPVQEDKKKRQYLSLFAPNVAFTSRKDPKANSLSASVQPAPAVVTPTCLPLLPTISMGNFATPKPNSSKRITWWPKPRRRIKPSPNLHPSPNKGPARSIHLPGRGLWSSRELSLKRFSSIV